MGENLMEYGKKENGNLASTNMMIMNMKESLNMTKKMKILVTQLNMDKEN